MNNNIRVNETPVRTSRSFNINDIILENFNIPEELPEFKDNSKNEELNLEFKTKMKKVRYGVSEDFTEQIEKYANVRKSLLIDTKSNDEIIVPLKMDLENKILVDDIKIFAKKGAKATVIVKYETQEDIEAYHNGRILLYAEENAKVKVIVLNFINTKSNQILAIQNELEENARVDYTIVDFGGKNSVTNYYTNLFGKSSNNSLHTIYLGKDEQLFDLNYIGELRGEKSNIDIEVQGALKDKAKKHFKGTIDFKRGCKKAKGNENEYCMLLSNNAKSIALPMLLCTEEDVEGNHSTASGKVDEQELFYIMSRGISYKDAVKLIVRAKFNKILERISNEELKQEVLDEIDRRLEE